MSGYENRLRKDEWLVADVPLLRARRLVAEYHYAGGASNTAAHCHGLYRRRDLELFGVVWWIPPTRDAASSLARDYVLGAALPCFYYGPAAFALAALCVLARGYGDPNRVLSLSRLVVVPGAPKNAATFMLAASVKRLAPRWLLLVTYADCWRGHTGHIYRAAGWDYLGLTKPERVYVRGGRMLSRKAGPKTRTHAQMLELGAECVGAFSKHRFRLVRKVRGAMPPALSTQLGLLGMTA